MFKQNRINLFSKMDKKSMALFHSGYIYPKTADQDFPFETNKNFFYLTGITQENVILMMVKNSESTKAFLFIEKSNPVLEKWIGKKLTKEEAKEIADVDNVFYLDDFQDIIFRYFNSSRMSVEVLEKVYLDLERRNSPHNNTWAFEYAGFFQKNYPEVAIINSYNFVIGLRMIKNDDEVSRIQKSIDCTKEGIESLMRNCKKGMYEYQLESYFDFHLKNSDQRTVSFQTICASGQNATILHYVNNDKILEDGELILFDLGCRGKDFYISDISRTFPVNGKFTKRQKDVYQAVLDVNKKCISFLKAGITWNEYNQYAKELLTEHAISLGLITNKLDINKYYWHSIGHSIGLDTHDPSLANLPLQKGMVITVEPGLYIEEEKIGVRIEDNVLITEDGCINLSHDVIKEVEDIEKFMKK